MTRQWPRSSSAGRLVIRSGVIRCERRCLMRWAWNHPRTPLLPTHLLVSAALLRVSPPHPHSSFHHHYINLNIYLTLSSHSHPPSPSRSHPSQSPIPYY